MVKPQADILYARGFLRPPGYDAELDNKEDEEAKDVDIEIGDDAPQNLATPGDQNNVPDTAEKSKTPTENPKTSIEKVKTPA